MATRGAAGRRASTVPATMRAAVVDRFGPPAALRLRTLPVPEPESREVLIALHAAGVGVWDASIRDGTWQPAGRSRFPLIPGIDGAGIVVRKGARVRRFRTGDRVYALDFAKPNGGFYAEYVAVDAEHVAHVPRRLDLPLASAAVSRNTPRPGRQKPGGSAEPEHLESLPPGTSEGRRAMVTPGPSLTPVERP